jgi:hypothetical protein
LNVPHRVGQPATTPAEFIDTPAGRPVALSVGPTPAFWSGPEVVILNQTGVPAVDERVVLATAMAPCTRRLTANEEGVTVAAASVGVKFTEYVPTGADDQLNRPAELSVKPDGSDPAGA